jgi:2-keto-3-deoxy-L-fuconate dehydrogenase
MIFLKDKIAVVTGAGSGLGQAIAELFARAGALVWVVDVDARGGAETVARITAAKGQASFIKLDVTREEEFHAAVQTVPAADIVVANAGIGHVGTIQSTVGADFDRVMAVNVRGVFNTMKAWLPAMLSRGRGSIINMCSTTGLGGSVDRLAYSASKHAVLGLTRSAALDLAKTGVRVNCLCPGRIATPFIEARLKEYPDPKWAFEEMCASQAMGRMGKPEEVAFAALYLASDEAAFVTGSALAIDGGWTAGMF